MLNTTSLWLATSSLPDFKPLIGPTECDVLVIGGGIAGVLTAVQLCEAGQRVTVIDSGRIGHAATGNTTAKLTIAHGAIYGSLGSHSKAYVEANQWGMEWIVGKARSLTTKCDLEERSMVVFAETAQEFETMKAEYTVLRDSGVPVEWVDKLSLPLQIRGGVSYPGQFQFHPLKFMQSMVEQALALGCTFYEYTRVVEVIEDEPCVVKTERGTIGAGKVVVATNFPVYDPALYSARLAPYRDYAVAVTIDGALPSEMSIGASDASLSFRTHEDTVIVSGQMHKVGQADTTECFDELLRKAKEIFPVKEVKYQWSTQDCMSLDRMPYIGPIGTASKHVFVITGFSGWGMSTSAYAAKIISDLVIGEANSWAPTFDPHRWKGLSGVKTFLKENTNVAQRWLGDKIWNTEDVDIDDLLPGEAAILSLDGQKVAAFKDADGNLHAVSPICTHLGCDLTWNSAERSWDCPCHGSRFDFAGKVLQGPATEDLYKYL